MKKILVIISGIIVLVVGIILFLNAKGLEKRCTAEAIGKVVDFKIEEGTETEDGYVRTTYTYFPIIEYKAGNKTVTKQSSIGSQSKKYSINDQVDILYNPDNIEEYTIKGDSTSNYLSIIFIIVGIIIVLVGVFKRI